jgi:hypothetical protein
VDHHGRIRRRHADRAVLRVGEGLVSPDLRDAQRDPELEPAQRRVVHKPYRVRGGNLYAQPMRRSTAGGRDVLRDQRRVCIGHLRGRLLRRAQRHGVHGQYGVRERQLLFGYVRLALALGVLVHDELPVLEPLVYEKGPVRVMVSCAA